MVEARAEADVVAAAALDELERTGGLQQVAERRALRHNHRRAAPRAERLGDLRKVCLAVEVVLEEVDKCGNDARGAQVLGRRVLDAVLLLVERDDEGHVLGREQARRSGRRGRSLGLGFFRRTAMRARWSRTTRLRGSWLHRGRRNR